MSLVDRHPPFGMVLSSIVIKRELALLSNRSKDVDYSQEQDPVANVAFEEEGAGQVDDVAEGSDSQRRLRSIVDGIKLQFELAFNRTAWLSPRVRSLLQQKVSFTIYLAFGVLFAIPIHHIQYLIASFYFRLHVNPTTM